MSSETYEQLPEQTYVEQPETTGWTQLLTAPLNPIGTFRR